MGRSCMHIFIAVALHSPSVRSDYECSQPLSRSCAWLRVCPGSRTEENSACLGAHILAHTPPAHTRRQIIGANNLYAAPTKSFAFCDLAACTTSDRCLL